MGIWEKLQQVKCDFWCLCSSVAMGPLAAPHSGVLGFCAPPCAAAAPKDQLPSTTGTSPPRLPSVPLANLMSFYILKAIFPRMSYYRPVRKS